MMTPFINILNDNYFRHFYETLINFNGDEENNQLLISINNLVNRSENIHNIRLILDLMIERCERCERYN